MTRWPQTSGSRDAATDRQKELVLTGFELAREAGAVTGAISREDHALIERTRKVNKTLSMFVLALQECRDISPETQANIADTLVTLADAVQRRTARGHRSTG